MTFALPDLVDNRKVTQRTLAEVLRSLLADAVSPSLSIATAYFNFDALCRLEPELHRLTSLRLLVGKEQEREFVLADRLRLELERRLSMSGLPEPSITLPELQKWQGFLQQHKVQVRRYDKAFLHGKAYLVEGVPLIGSIGIVGSSNFTGAGLSTNLELNAVLKQQAAVDELRRWFDALWNESEDYKAAVLDMLSDFTRAYTPYELYIKVLYEAYSGRLGTDLSERDGKPSPIALADFQRDGYLAAKEILDNYGGVLIADSVGLGKSYLALRLLEDYAYHERQTALVICPAALMGTLWRRLLQRFAIPHEIISMERFSQKDFPVDEYARRFKVIVVDESHNFRNPNANRWENLFRLLASGDPDKKIILMTATPVNNTVFDLYHQLRLITRDTPDFFAAAGISDLFRYFLQAEANRDALYEVLEAIAVRRSRRFIRQNYPNAEIDGQPVRFPDRELRSVSYSLEASYGKALYERIARAIEHLFLAPYQVDTFRKEVMQPRQQRTRQLSLFESEEVAPLKQRLIELGWPEEQAREFVMSVGRQTAIAHIMRVLYLKRLESSVEALRVSLQRQRDFQGAFLTALEHGRLLDSKAYRRWLQLEAGDDDVEDEPDLTAILDQLPLLPTEKYELDALRRAVEADIRSLNELLSDLEQLTIAHDDKLHKLKELLTGELKGKKVVVFSYFRDTARYLYRNLTSDPGFLQRLGHGQISLVDSGVAPDQRRDRIVRFAPKANGRDDLPPEQQIQLLISTDVLSEGQNLQDADTIVNYDLHWNPVRLVQRVGRLDRVGSPYGFVYVYNFVPEDALEHLLGLLQRLYERLDAINRTVGLDASVLGETPNPMDFNTLRRIARADERVIDELEAESEMAIGEFLLQDLLRFLKQVGEDRLKKVPLGVGTAKNGRNKHRGFFAAFRNAKTNQHYWLFDDERTGKVIVARLDAIRPIRCGPDEPGQPLPEGFDHQARVEKLRKHLLTSIRQVAYRQSSLPPPQNQIVNWLHALPPSAERNELLAYFEHPLPGTALRDLRRLWRERARMSERQWMQRMRQFMVAHPHPDAVKSTSTEEVTEMDLECIAWVAVM